MNATTTTITSTAPTTITAPLRRVLGVDVSDVQVRRGAVATGLAQRFDARGFTAAGVVHLPDSLGVLDGAMAAPVLAHELTHAVQQRLLGGALPAPDTPEGRVLEAEAVAVEQWFAGDGPAAELPWAPPANPVRHPEVQLAPRAAEPQPGSIVVRERSEAPDGVELLLQLAREQEEDSSSAVEDEDDDEPEDRPEPLSVDEVVRVVGERPPRRWVDLDDSGSVEELGNRLYQELLCRLRFDLLVERERSGSLSDWG
ncbi:hypothetical protein BJP25_20130 [Actinokineospora bangkokensis]|uniref:eCIS core domain-containing protein n=2 Tax=Actinokineospora bangkokensis TaxID=1193682 RepID=A0A1Q9LK20_9PSEU|nr:hypothetical protein BJP25_20130 [Actinokineospora bangkokensis]